MLSESREQFGYYPLACQWASAMVKALILGCPCCLGWAANIQYTMRSSVYFRKKVSTVLQENMIAGVFILYITEMRQANNSVFRIGIQQHGNDGD